MKAIAPELENRGGRRALSPKDAFLSNLQRSINVRPWNRRIQQACVEYLGPQQVEESVVLILQIDRSI